MRKADNLPPSCAIVMKSGNLNLQQPSGPLQTCNGTAFNIYRSPGMLTLCMFGLYLLGALSAEVPFVILHQDNGCFHFNPFCVICDILYIENSILCHFCQSACRFGLSLSYTVLCSLTFHSFTLHSIDVTESDKVYMNFWLSEA